MESCPDDRPCQLGTMSRTTFSSSKWLSPTIVEVPIPDQDPIGNLKGTGMLMRLELLAP